MCLCCYVFPLSFWFRKVSLFFVLLQLTEIWNMSASVVPEFQQYVDNIVTFKDLLTQLAQSSPSVDPNLQQLFQLNSILDTFKNFAEKPEKYVVHSSTCDPSELQFNFFSFQGLWNQTHKKCIICKRKKIISKKGKHLAVSISFCLCVFFFTVSLSVSFFPPPPILCLH